MDSVVTNENEQFLKPGRFIDSAEPSVVAFAHKAAGGGTEIERVLRLYRTVRDTIVYDPYVDVYDPVNYHASGVLAAGRGYCVGKSALLVASLRAIGVPARPGYADVKNHLTSRRLYEAMQTDVFIWHSYSDICLNGRWVKATPAFDSALCERVGLHALEFDGSADSLFHPFDRSGRRHMEYMRDRGPYADVPFDLITADFRAFYPGISGRDGFKGDFHAEVVSGDQ